jgi:predicted amidohydrolase
MKVALVQVASPLDEPVSARRTRVGEMVADAAGADLIVLPELWGPGYFSFDSYPLLAEPMSGDTVGACRQWARQLHCHLHLGSFLECDSAGGLHNTALLIGPGGEIVHSYRKIHVFGYQSRERELLVPGNTLSVSKSALGPIAATTCYDLRFPELWRALIDAGAETVVVPAAWPAARREHWRLFTSTRAVEEQILLIACNAVGVQSGVELGGYSRVVDPWGTVLVEAGAEEGVVTCEVDPAVVATAREEFPVLSNRAAWLQSAPSATEQ